MAIYGYSLCAFVPLTLLNFIPAASVPWLSELVAAGASVAFLMKALGPTVREKAPQHALPFLGCLGCVGKATSGLKWGGEGYARRSGERGAHARATATGCWLCGE